MAIRKKATEHAGNFDSLVDQDVETRNILFLQVLGDKRVRVLDGHVVGNVKLDGNDCRRRVNVGREFSPCLLNGWQFVRAWPNVSHIPYKICVVPHEHNYVWFHPQLVHGVHSEA
jgi:hypothetical protein